MITISTETTISAAHFVQTADEDSPCRNLHGHNWKIEINITSFSENALKEDGMIIDFRKIKSEINNLDHKVLLPNHLYHLSECEDKNLCMKAGEYVFPSSSVALLSIEVVTCETLALYIKRLITNLIKNNEFIVHVKVYETEKSYAYA